MTGPLQARYIKIEGKYGWIATVIQAVFWAGFVMAVFTLIARRAWADGRLFEAWCAIAAGYGIPLGCVVLIVLVAMGKLPP